MGSKEVVDYLNDILKHDPAAISMLFTVRRQCSKSLADHPLVEVICQAKDGPYFVGLLGILNGLLRASGQSQYLFAKMDDAENQNIVEFYVADKPKEHKPCEACGGYGYVEESSVS